MVEFVEKYSTCTKNNNLLFHYNYLEYSDLRNKNLKHFSRRYKTMANKLTVCQTSKLVWDKLASKAKCM